MSVPYSEDNKRITDCPFYVPKENQFFSVIQKAYRNNQRNPYQASVLGHTSGYNLGVPGSINSFKREFYQVNKK